MKLRFNDNYIKIVTKTTQNRLKSNNHHLLPNQFMEDSETIKLPYNLHLSLHKNFTNHQLLMDPIGCLIKCIDSRQPIERIPLTMECFIKKQPIIKNKKLIKMIKNGWLYNVCF